MGSLHAEQHEYYLQAIRNMAEAAAAVLAVHEEYAQAIQAGVINDQLAGWRPRVVALSRLIEEERLTYEECWGASGQGR